MKMIDRKRAPVLREETHAQLPAREERESILARARAAVTGRALVPVSAAGQRGEPRSAVPVRTERQMPASAKAPARNLPAVAKGGRGVPARQAARGARRSHGEGESAPAAPVVAQRMEVPRGQATAAAQNSGSGQTIIVQVSAPQPSYPWWGPWWWGYPSAGCGARLCPRRLGQSCTRWLCGW
jgi:hypothetical protein